MMKRRVALVPCFLLCVALIGCQQKAEKQETLPDRFTILVNDKLGFINGQGEVIVEPQYEAIYSYHDGLACVRKDKKWGYIDLNGQYVIAPQFEDVEYFEEGLASVKMDNKWGFIDKSGKFIIQPQFLFCHVF